jgi:phage terminase large subunit
VPLSGRVAEDGIRSSPTRTSTAARSDFRTTSPSPWWTTTLEAERRFDAENYPERYDHIWEGDYAKAFEGAYFSALLEQARRDGRICHVPLDPVLPVKAFFDIGGAGHSSDAMAIWIAQFVGREIRLLDYIDGVGQPLGYYATELRRRGWKDAVIHLPHDGVATNNISGKLYRSLDRGRLRMRHADQKLRRRRGNDAY